MDELDAYLRLEDGDHDLSIPGRVGPTRVYPNL